MILGTARGKLGDVVFYRTGGEQRFRTRVKPTNPQTNAQVLQRIVVATVVKSYADLVEICDHAFQNFEGKAKNQERFMRLNIKKLRTIALYNVKSWSPLRLDADNYGNWNLKESIKTKVNPYIISEGDLPSISIEWANTSLLYKQDVPRLTVPLKRSNDTWAHAALLTYRNIVDILGLNDGDQLTFIVQRADKETGNIINTQFARVILMPNNGNMNELFFVQGTEHRFTINLPNKENYGRMLFLGSTSSQTPATIDFYVSENENAVTEMSAAAIIVSRYDNKKWRRSKTTLLLKPGMENIASIGDAIASYDINNTSSLYLNQADSK